MAGPWGAADTEDARMIVTTTNGIEGRRITAYRGVVVGEAIMYKAGGGAQKAISVREIKAIRMTDAVKNEFEVVTSNHSYKFRGSDKTNAFQWVNGLQQLHNRVLHAK